MVSAGIAWTASAVFVVSNVVDPSGVVLAERTLYLASVGACLAGGWLWGLGDGLGEPSRCRARRGPGGGVSPDLNRSRVWRDEATFFPRLVVDAPGSYRATGSQGCCPICGAIRCLVSGSMRRGFTVYSGNGAMWSDFAVVLERQRRWSEAAGAFWACSRRIRGGR